MSFSRVRGSYAALVVFAFGAALPVIAACNKGTSAPTVTAATASVKQPAPRSLAPLPDAAIAQAILRHFDDEGVLRSHHLHVTVHKGVANVSGTVSNLPAKQRALSVTDTIRGVRAVVDQVVVMPVARDDDKIKTDVASALQRDVATHPYTIGVAVKEGKVTLSGTAESWQQRDLFANVAKEVQGVKAIDNAVALHYAVVPPESEIAANVKNRIANDAWLDGDEVVAKVADHTVRLSGLVASVSQKMRAHADAWVAGVDPVDDSALLVDSDMAHDQKAITGAPMKSDAMITSAVSDAFRFDPRLKTRVPKVSVADGTVTLTGTVDSIEARRAAAADATDTLGVWGVRNEVLVTSFKPPSDAEIEATVKRALAEDVLLSDSTDVQVSGAKGKIFLRGPIASGFERFDIVEDASSVPGVAEIHDKMTVKLTPAEIASRVDDRLVWDPMVPRDRVIVAVGPNGVATLTGTLDEQIEIRAAADDALWGGAAHVVNLLRLKNHPDVMAP